MTKSTIEKALKDYDSFTSTERSAWDAWFNGGRCNVTQYESMPDAVFMGKAECEWVPFTDFWLEKLSKLGWVKPEIMRTYIAKGMVGQPNANEYFLQITELGCAVRKAELERYFKRREESA